MTRLLRLLLVLIACAPGTLRADESDAAADPREKTTRLGPVTATVRLEPEAPVIGDNIELTLTVVAEAEVELIMPEFEDGLDRFSIFGFAPSEKIDGEGRTVAEQRYTLQPPRSGEHSIPSLVVEFVDRRPGNKPAPDGDDAYELLTERLDFTVQSVLPDDAKADLRPPLGSLAPLPEPRAPRWPWYVGGIVVLAVAAPFVLRAYLHWRRLARRKSAYELARARLDELVAAGTPSSESMEPFYVELSAIVRRYLEDRFELRAPELTTEEFLDVASSSPDVTNEHQVLLRSFLRQADLVKFAHSVPGAGTVEESLQSARRFLEETRENAPLLDVEDEAAAQATGKAEPGHSDGETGARDDGSSRKEVTRV